MKKRRDSGVKDSGLEGYMKGGIHDWRDSGLDGFRTRRIHERSDTGKKGSMQRDLYYKRRDAVQDDTGQLVSTTGGMQDWRDA